MSFRLLKRFNFLNRNCSHETTRSAKTLTPPLPHLYPTSTPPVCVFAAVRVLAILKRVLIFEATQKSNFLKRFNLKRCELVAVSKFIH